MENRIMLLSVFLILTIYEFSTADSIQTTKSNEKPENMTRTFLYFAYGSNMLTKRIHINNPSAVQKYIGKLKDHRIDFITYSKRWKGCASTIVPTPNYGVAGVVWEIDISNLPNLDEQEGVHSNFYFAKNVTISTSTGQDIECRTYQQCQLPEEYVDPSLLPPERQPSLVYLNTMINGAKEHHIPNDYIKYLESFRHNGYDGEIEIGISINNSANTRM